MRCSLKARVEWAGDRASSIEYRGRVVFDICVHLRDLRFLLGGRLGVADAFQSQK
jgi:hypothetical protein